MNSRVASLPRGLIEYARRGHGPVVLVCHGTSSDCSSAGLAGALPEAGFAVLTPSYPDYGRTELMLIDSSLRKTAASSPRSTCRSLDQCATIDNQGKAEKQQHQPDRGGDQGLDQQPQCRENVGG